MAHPLETGDERYARITRELGTKRREEQRLAPRVIARYLTLAGQSLHREDIEITVTETGPRDTEQAYSTVSRCSGCQEETTVHWETRPWRSLSHAYEEISVREAAEEAEGAARRWSLKHSTECRQIPVSG